MDYYLGKLAVELSKAGLTACFCRTLGIIFVVGDVTIQYLENGNVYLIKKKDDADIFEVDTPVEEMIDWMRQMEEFGMLVYADRESTKFCPFRTKHELWNRTINLRGIHFYTIFDDIFF